MSNTMNNKKAKFSTVLLFSAASAVMSAVPMTAQAAETKFSNDTYKYLELFGDVFERVRRDYVEEVTDQQLLENAIDGMLTSLDPHSGYMPAKSFQDMQEQTKGEFGGLGIEVNMENGLVRVVSPIDDTPAAKAGVQPGDYIIALDAKPLINLTLNEAVEKMRGAPDTELTVTIRRQGVEPFDLKMKRAVIKVQSVRSRVEGDIGYIRVTSFNEQSQNGLEAAIKELNTKLGGKLKGYVLDLRNNPGGLLDQAVSISDSFLDRGEIVSTRTRRLEDTQRYNAKAGDLAQGKPMVVLINDGSASASEIVAGALQDHGRAVILGVKSFGKGSVQTIIPLGRGESAMRLTTARYYTPSGRSIQATGIEPDIEVKQALIQRAAGPRFNRAEADLPGALRNDTTNPQTRTVTPAPSPAPPPANATPPAPGALNAPGASNAAPDPNAEPKSGTQDTDDYQLARALDLLRGISIYQRASAEPVK